jgi:cell division protein FtsL
MELIHKVLGGDLAALIIVLFFGVYIWASNETRKLFTEADVALKNRYEKQLEYYGLIESHTILYKESTDAIEKKDYKKQLLEYIAKSRPFLDDNVINDLVAILRAENQDDIDTILRTIKEKISEVSATQKQPSDKNYKFDLLIKSISPLLIVGVLLTALSAIFSSTWIILETNFGAYITLGLTVLIIILNRNKKKIR